jgi:6-phosphogluconolactonase/glucosamine-6-phosphate isomerase/deaminase
MFDNQPFGFLKKNSEHVIATPEDFAAPLTKYFKTKAEFDIEVGKDFIKYVNKISSKGDECLVGLAHGQSPAGVYRYIYTHFKEIQYPQKLKFTATNSHLKRQRDLKGVFNATEFLKSLIEENLIAKDQIIGKRYNRENLQDYADNYNEIMSAYLTQQKKVGFDYVFTASDPGGKVAAITRKSSAFASQEIMVVVDDRKEEELTVTPHFLMQSKHIAFLATKSDKRRALAWLYARWGRKDESPSFLRFVDDVEKRVTVYVDDQALTWPQIEIIRKTEFGDSSIKIDTGVRYNEDAVRKLPVVLMVHGFLGLNSYDGLLTAISSRKYIAAAMHYGTIPDALPPKLYSQHVMKNIDYAIQYFGKKGHPVYLFDHSMGNVYFKMMNQKFQELEGVKNYLRGRIGANPFFGEEAKHAFIGFLDLVIIPSFSIVKNPVEKSGLMLLRNMILPLMPKWEVRRQGIQWTKMAIGRNSIMSTELWDAIKIQILQMMSGMDSVPALNRIPIEQALSRLPAKIFVIQIFSALIESKNIDWKQGLKNMEKHNIKILILKSERDGVAKYDPKYYNSPTVKVMGVTNFREKDLFREHLYHMVEPIKTTQIIDEFIREVEAQYQPKPSLQTHAQ